MIRNEWLEMKGSIFINCYLLYYNVGQIKFDHFLGFLLNKSFLKSIPIENLPWR